MPFLATFLASILGGILAGLTKIVGHRLAVGTAFLTVVAALTLSLYAIITNLMAFAFVFVTNEYFLMAVYALWPTNADAAITACLAADSAAFVYRHKVMLLKVMAQA